MKHVTMLIICLLLVSSPARALDPLEEQAAMLQTENILNSLPGDSRNMVGEADRNGSGFGKKMYAMLKNALTENLSQLDDVLQSAKRTLAVVVLAALGLSALDGRAKQAVRLVAVSTLLVLFAADLNSMIAVGTETVEQLHVFSQTLLPVMAGASAASGMTASSAALYAASSGFFSVLISILRWLLLPLVKVYLCLSAADAALDGSPFSAIKKFAASIMKSSLRILIFIFTGYISLTGVVAGSADALSVKAAKMAVSSVVPVVGSMISDASETVLVSAKLLLQSVGVTGMLGGLAIIVVPFVRLGIRYCVMNLTVLLSSVFDCGKISGFLEDTAKAGGFLLGIVVCSCLMLFVSCICFMRVSVP